MGMISGNGSECEYSEESGSSLGHVGSVVRNPPDPRATTVCVRSSEPLRKLTEPIVLKARVLVLQNAEQVDSREQRCRAYRDAVG